MLQRFLHNRTAMITVAIVLLTALVGIFAPFIAPNDPYETDILNKFAGFSTEYPLGTDNLGRCILSRMIYGIRPTLGLAVLTMLGTIGLGALMGRLAGYFRGIPEEIIMRTVDVMLSFPSQIMVFAVVALLGINVQNVILANVFIKWAWYARMIRTGVMQRTETAISSSFPDAWELRRDSSCSAIWCRPSQRTSRFSRHLMWAGRSSISPRFHSWDSVYRHRHRSGGRC